MHHLQHQSFKSRRHRTNSVQAPISEILQFCWTDNLNKRLYFLLSTTLLNHGSDQNNASSPTPIFQIKASPNQFCPSPHLRNFAVLLDRQFEQAAVFSAKHH